MKMLMLISSHGMALALGWVLFFKLPIPERSVIQPAEVIVPRQDPSPMPADPGSDNAILRASSADFRALWRALHLSGKVEGGDGPDGISVFMDWCARDPEAAILALRDTFQPTYSHNYLNNAVGEQGLTLADSLLEHWRELSYVKKVRYALNNAITQVALQDPRRGAQMMAQLPADLREVDGTGVFDQMNEEQMRVFLVAYEEAGGLASARGAAGQPWGGVAGRVNEIDPENGLASWFPRLEGEAAHGAFARELAQRAIRFERWDQLFEVLAPLEGERRAWVLNPVGREAQAAVSRRGGAIPLLEASVRSGNWEVLDLVLQPPDAPTSPESPQVLLDWAFGAAGPGLDPLAIRHAIALALRSNRAETLERISRLDDPAQRRAALAAVEESGTER